MVRWDNKGIDIAKVKSANDKSKIVPWDTDLDIAYMKKNGMLSKEDLKELDELYTNVVLTSEKLGMTAGYLVEACENLDVARKFVALVQKLAKKYNANFFIVTDGASGYSNGNGRVDPAVKNAREQQKKWEKENGFDPDEDWGNDPKYKTESDILENASLEESVFNFNPELKRWIDSTSITFKHETARKNLPDSAFGIPEDRKYPLDTEQHVKSAIKLFGHAEESKKKSLARRIQSAARKYDIKIPETTQCYKYLHESVSDIVPDGIDTIIFGFGSVIVGSRVASALLEHPEIPDELCIPIKDFIYDVFFYTTAHADKCRVQMMNVEEAKARFMQYAPDEYKPYCDYVFESFPRAIYEYDYTNLILKAFRDRGYKLYYLSNWDKYSYDLEIGFFKNFCSKFDGGIFSFEINDMKPNESMYKMLLNKYNIDPAKALFFDDKHVNVEAARKVGMNAYVFNKFKTPQIILGEALSIPANTDDFILAQTDNGFINIPVSDITWWYICENDRVSSVDSDLYYSTLEDCVLHKVNDYINKVYFKDNLYLTEYVYISNLSLDDQKQGTDEHRLVKLGEINIFESGGFEWVTQLPIKMIDRELMPLREWSMASVNPIIGITKPYIINTGEKLGLMTDIESDKCLVVNRDHELEVQSTDKLEINEVYEFIGDQAFIDRLNTLYKESAKVDNLYTILTNKPMLTEDQIDFDPAFRKIDFDLYEQKALSEFVTMRDKIMEACGINIEIFRPNLAEIPFKSIPAFMSKYNTLGDIQIREDFDGVYFYSDLTKKRSASVASTTMLTENMIKSILL